MMEQTPLSPIFWNKVLGGGTPGPTPSGTISITENGTYDVAQYAEAEINVAGSDGEVVLLASGEYVLLNDAVRLDIPIDLSGNQMVSYLVETPRPLGVKGTYAAWGVMPYPQEVVDSGMYGMETKIISITDTWRDWRYGKSATSPQNINVLEASGDYPFRSGVYTWKVWGRIV